MAKKSYFSQKTKPMALLPKQFRHDDVRLPKEFLEPIIKEYTDPGEMVLDPFAGFGTTLSVSESLGREAIGIEYDFERVQYIKSIIRNPEHIIHGDARFISNFQLPPADFCFTSPPFAFKGEPEDALTAYTQPGMGYDHYLIDMHSIFSQIKKILKPRKRLVLEVSNIKTDTGVTALAWDIAHELSSMYKFLGERVICWEKYYGYGYDHSYLLVFKNQ